jgi:hypothetical protein
MWKWASTKGALRLDGGDAPAVDADVDPLPAVGQACVANDQVHARAPVRFNRPIVAIIADYRNYNNAR